VEITVWKDGFEWRQTFSRGRPTSKLEQIARAASTARQ